MKVVNVGGRAALLADQRVYDLEDLSDGTIAPDPMAVLHDHWEHARELAQRGAFEGGQDLSNVRLGAAVPNPGSIFGLVANYPPARLRSPIYVAMDSRLHAAEGAGQELGHLLPTRTGHCHHG